MPFYYAASFSRDILGMSYTNSLNVLFVLNGVGLLGRLVPTYLADHFGPINVFIPTAFIACLSVFAWMAVVNSAGVYAWASVFGIAAGGVQGLFPSAVGSLTRDEDLDKIGVRLGMAFTILSFVVLTGPPIAGALITANDGKYFGVQGFTGASLAVGIGFMVAARTVRVRRNGLDWKVKV